MRYALTALMFLAIGCFALAAEEPREPADVKKEIARLEEENARLVKRCAEVEEWNATLRELNRQLLEENARLTEKAGATAPEPTPQPQPAPSKTDAGASKAKDARGAPPADPFQAGSEWKGSRTIPNGKSQGVVLFVKSRTGDKIRGTLSITRVDGETTPYSYTGTVSGGNRVALETEKVGPFHQWFDGRLDGSAIDFDWRGTTDHGNSAQGTGRVALR